MWTKRNEPKHTSSMMCSDYAIERLNDVILTRLKFTYYEINSFREFIRFRTLVYAVCIQICELYSFRIIWFKKKQEERERSAYVGICVIVNHADHTYTHNWLNWELRCFESTLKQWIYIRCETQNNSFFLVFTICFVV